MLNQLHLVKIVENSKFQKIKVCWNVMVWPVIDVENTPFFLPKSSNRAYILDLSQECNVKSIAKIYIFYNDSAIVAKMQSVLAISVDFRGIYHM